MKKTSIFVAAALAATLAAPAVLAQDAQASMDAMRVVRDKQTGQLRAPNSEELKQMLDAEKADRKARGQPEPSADSQPVQVRTYASGMRAAVLGPEFLVSLEAHRDADGNLAVRHADPAEEHITAPNTALPTE
jgi:hypothetical protein